MGFEQTWKEGKGEILGTRDFEGRDPPYIEVYYCPDEEGAALLEEERAIVH